MKATNQLELEQQNLDIVIQRTLSEINKASQSHTLADIKQANNIIPFYVGELETKLNLYVHEAILGTAKVKPVPAKAMTLISPMVVAHYVVKAMVNIAGANFSATQIYSRIAKTLEVEYNLNCLKSKDVEIHAKFVAYLKHTGYSGNRLDKITTDLLTKYHKDIGHKNLASVFMQVAQVAVYLLSECRPIMGGTLAPLLIHVTTIKSGKDTSKVVIHLADWVLDWMKQQTMDGNMLPAYHTALIEQPKPWTSMRVGGFHSDKFVNNFIKTRVEHDKYTTEQMQNTMVAVNNIQNTEWEINKDILEVMLYAFDNKLDWGELPAPMEIMAPPYPFPDLTRDQMNDEQKATVKSWATHKAALHDENHSAISRYLALNRVLNEAKRFAQYDKFYFAYQVDFRGRIYPIAANLHPQGSSFVKPLLRFHEGKVINNKQAEMYLALQGANTYGEDKIRLDEKHAWVIKNEAKIINSAKNPIHEDFWKSADEPWSFLAFCFEWMGYKADPKQFLSKLPIALDGSCNGLQHLSAMLRDEVGGKEVNLTANVKKEDIYSAVKKIAIQALSEMEEPMAARIIAFGIERSTCKRPVMIMPYAGTQSSCRDYVMDDFVERGGKQIFGDELNAAVSLTSATIWQSIGQVVIKGREIMSWFKKSARKAAKMSPECELHWVTPNGFLVIQKRVKTKDVLYQTSMGTKINVRLSITLQEETDETDLSGHSSAVSPNFIHSLDACALQETVTLAHSNGINSFAMIHDSYGTHAADTANLAKYLRRVFVDMYKNHDVLKRWINCQPESARAEFPELPQRGNLNLEDIMDSEHFFA